MGKQWKWKQIVVFYKKIRNSHSKDQIENYNKRAIKAVIYLSL